jgi:N-glycosylase/DNA lyase
VKIRLDSSFPFNLDFTLCCGQAFRWNRRGQWWYGVVRSRVLKARQDNDGLEIENADVKFAKNYFGLDDDLPRILSQLSKDEHIKRVVKMFKGLRILRQDPWECLISYICATYKNIAAIKHMLLNLSRNFGERISLDGYDFHLFPQPETLANATTTELTRCGLGFRARYVRETARMVRENDHDFNALKETSYEKARTELLGFPGVGLKVADCVSLFSLGKLEAFPIDVWIRRVILRHYSNHLTIELAKSISCKESLSKADYERLSLFGRQYFGQYAGYAQEYLYHYERMQQ